MLNGKGKGGKQGGIPNRRQEERKQFQDPNQLPAVMQTNSGFESARQIERKKLSESMPAHVLSSQDVHCWIQDVSEKGLCIISSVTLKVAQSIGVFFELPQETFPGIGITLICKVVWHKPYSAGMAHLTGLQIETCTDSQSYKNFVNSLPIQEQAHA